MVDAVLILTGAALLAVVLLALSHAALGRPTRRRIAAAACVALVGSLVIAWRISKSTSFQLIGEPITRVATSSRVVALTFDDGPDPRYLDGILDTLRAANVHATFFAIGDELEQHPELGPKIVAAGHELGNHSFTHPRMVLRSLAFMRDEIQRTDDAIRRAGYGGAIQFRPPNGKRLLGLPWVLRELGRSAVLWDVAPDSEDPSTSAAQIVERVRAEVQPGSIVLMHLMGSQRGTSRAALPQVIHELAEQGYRFVTVSELLSLRP